MFFKFFGRIAKTVVIVAAVNEIFRDEFCSAYFFNQPLKPCWRSACNRTTLPVFPYRIIEYERELIQKLGKPHYARFAVFPVPLFMCCKIYFLVFGAES